MAYFFLRMTGRAPLLLPETTWPAGAAGGLRRLVAASALAVAGAALVSTEASAITLGFERVPVGNSPADAAGQLSVEVTDAADGNGAIFDFRVSDGANPDANVSEVYFSDVGGLFATPIEQSHITQSDGVNFVAGSANPGNLPGGENASPPFTATAGLLANANGRNQNGLTVGEMLAITLLYDGSSFEHVLEAIADGSLRVGLHVRSLLNGESDSFVSTPSVVPLPATLWLFLASLGGLGWLHLRGRGRREQIGAA